MSPRCCTPSFKIMGLPVLEKKIFKGFYHIWAWQPYWSCDLDNLYKLLFPLPRDAPCEVWLWMAKRFQRRRCLNIVNGRQWQRRRTPGHWYTISSPFEPDGSGELKKQLFFCLFKLLEIRLIEKNLEFELIEIKNYRNRSSFALCSFIVDKKSANVTQICNYIYRVEWTFEQTRSINILVNDWF